MLNLTFWFVKLTSASKFLNKIEPIDIWLDLFI